MFGPEDRRRKIGSAITSKDWVCYCLLQLKRVGTMSYADVARGTHRQSSNYVDAVHQPAVNGNEKLSEVEKEEGKIS
jgi:hypothetical protein